MGRLIVRARSPGRKLTVNRRAACFENVLTSRRALVE